MIDFSRAFAALTGSLGGSASSNGGSAHALSEILSRVGIDPAMLEGLTQNQIAQLLAEHGIDPAAFAGQQLSELTGQLGNAHPLTELASQFLSGERLKPS